MSETMYLIAVIAIASLTTILIRFLPFIVFSNGREVPAFIGYLEKTLSYSVMAMLVLFCLKDTSAETAIPTAAGVLTVVLVHVFRRNTLLSIITGTAVYMLLIRIL